MNMVLGISMENFQSLTIHQKKKKIIFCSGNVNAISERLPKKNNSKVLELIILSHYSDGTMQMGDWKNN